jgi:signal transduction histidine kinase
MQAGLARVRDGRLVEQIPWSTFGRSQQAKMLLAAHGGVWVGFWFEGGVSYHRDRRVLESYTAAAGLSKGNVASFRLDADGALWVATQDGGVSRIKDGRIATLTSRNGLPCDAVHWTIEDDDRAFWLYTRCALVRITRAVLDAWIADPTRRVEVALWDAADGVRLRSTAASEYAPPVAKSIDGRVWFLTGEGVQVVDPRHLPLNTQPPPVHIERIVADQTLQWDNVTGATVPSLRLPPRIRDLQIDYTALSLVAPEKVRFRYKLENQDSDWREVVNDRHVQYSNLHPGTYRFHVIASNNSGVWNEQGDALEFSVDAAYYQTGWFRALCAAGAMGLLWSGYRLRVRRLHHQFELALDARVSERMRIARELHDTLLQSFHGLLLRFQTASHLLPDRAAEAKERLDAAIAQAANAIGEGRDAVQGLRDSTSQDNDLPHAISTLGEELAASAGGHPLPRFAVTVEGTSRTLHPVLRDEVYKITAEAVRNAFRHAQATRVDVEIRYDAEQFRLRVQDDGTGFDAASLSDRGRHGHYGLSGMRERAAILGGNVTVWSKEGAGTAVELRIPGGTAYVRPRHGPWFRMFVRRRDA